MNENQEGELDEGATCKDYLQIRWEEGVKSGETSALPKKLQKKKPDPEIHGDAQAVNEPSEMTTT